MEAITIAYLDGNSNWEVEEVANAAALKTRINQLRALGLNPNYILPAYASSIGGIDEFTKLMLHMDGLDDGTVFTDDSASNHTISRFNTVTKTAVKKYGTASGYFNGTNTRLTAPTSADWAFGSGNFTIDFWFNMISHVTWDMLLMNSNGAANANSNWYIGIDDSAQLAMWIFQTDTSIKAFNTATVSGNGWNHFAAVRNGNDFKVAINGTFGSTVDVTGVTIRNLASTILTIGSNWDDSQNFNGYQDELRISKVARWTTDFTPVGPYTT